MVWVKSSQPWKYFLKSWSDCIILFEAQFAILNRLHRAILPLTFIPNCITATAQFSNYNKCFALTITIKTVLHALVTTFFFQQMFCHPLLCPSPFFLLFLPTDFLKMHLIMWSSPARFLLLENLWSAYIQSLYHYLWHNFSLIYLQLDDEIL